MEWDTRTGDTSGKIHAVPIDGRHDKLFLVKEKHMAMVYKTVREAMMQLMRCMEAKLHVYTKY